MPIARRGASSWAPRRAAAKTRAMNAVNAEQSWPLEAIYRDAKIGEIYEGANEVQKWIIARKLYGRAITG
jgi:alkylation response protein AidB-like acyl-CoA dehydrogenase